MGRITALPEHMVAILGYGGEEEKRSAPDEALFCSF